MNLIVLEDHHFINTQQARLTGRQHQHLTQIRKIQLNDLLPIGQLNGCMGHARVTHLDSESIVITLESMNTPPPPTLPLWLILALPRPKMLQRTLQTIATMGIEHLILVHTQKVEKSFWQTPLLQPQAIHQQLLLGLEQAKATQLPKISLYPQFKYFESDHSQILPPDADRFIAHPGNYPAAAATPRSKILAIGPEGGFTPQEVDWFTAQDFQPIQLGARILRVETAVPVLLAKLF